MRLGVFSPSASPTMTSELGARFERGLAQLETLGHEVVIARHARANRCGYVSSHVSDRVEDLTTLLKDRSIDGLIASNGGWNANELLPSFERLRDLILARRLPVIGFSDTTVLQDAMYALTGHVQFHGPTVCWGLPDASDVMQASFQAALAREPQQFTLRNFGDWIYPGSMQGTIIGGNLGTLATLLGTPYEPHWDGSIFLWEEVGASIRLLRRTLHHFKNAGVWKRIAGMVIGHLSDIQEEYRGQRFPVMEMVYEELHAERFPILHTPHIGHDTPHLLTVPIGGYLRADKSTVEMRCEKF